MVQCGACTKGEMTRGSHDDLRTIVRTMQGFYGTSERVPLRENEAHGERSRPERMKTDPKTTAGRAFVRSLNILLKFARLYGYDHARVAEQLKTAWSELRTALPESGGMDLLPGASGGQLLLDGVPLEGSPAEKQFAQLLSAAGLASVQFTPRITLEELSKF